jgi:hypothetical protein
LESMFVWPNFGYWSSICLEGLRKTMKIFSQETVPAEVRNEYVSYASLENYRYANSLYNYLLKDGYVPCTYTILVGKPEGKNH